jgi:hypothetical protein
MKIKDFCIYGTVLLFSLVVSSAWSDDVRPTPAQMRVVDSTCMQLARQQTNELDGAERYIAVFAWVKKNENGVDKWACAPGTTGEQPALGFKPVSVWTADDSDKQFIYFRSQVDAAIVAAVRDNIVTKDQVNQLIVDTTKDQLKAAVQTELKTNWGDLVKDAAAEVKKQLDADKAANPAPPATPKN